MEKLIRALRCFATEHEEDFTCPEPEDCPYRSLNDWSLNDWLDCDVDRMMLDAAEALEKLEKYRWIPTSERLPENKSGSEYYDSVIVTLDNGRVTEGCYVDRYEEWWVDAEDGEHYSINATGEVIAWMPFPEPYKGVKEND